MRHIFEEQKAVYEGKAAEQAAQTQGMIRMMTELRGKKGHDGQTQEASATGSEERGLSASPTPQEESSSTSEGAMFVEVGPRGDRLGRVDKTETTVSPMSQLAHATFVSNTWGCPRWYPRSRKTKVVVRNFENKGWCTQNTTVSTNCSRRIRTLMWGGII